MLTWSSRFGNGTKVLDQVFLGHTNTSVTNRKDLVVRIQFNLQVKTSKEFNKQKPTLNSTKISALKGNYLDFKLSSIAFTQDLLICQWKEPDLVQCLRKTIKYTKL